MGAENGWGWGEDDRALIKESVRKKDTVPFYLMFLKRERELEINKTSKETKIVYSNLYSFGGSINLKKFDYYIQRVSSMDG